MKKLDVASQVGKFDNDFLDFLANRLEQRACGDLSDVLDEVSKVDELDRWFKSANSSDEFFDMLDIFTEQILRESNKRIRRNK